jgi:hypothetical protein
MDSWKAMMEEDRRRWCFERISVVLSGPNIAEAISAAQALYKFIDGEASPTELPPVREAA